MSRLALALTLLLTAGGAHASVSLFGIDGSDVSRDVKKAIERVERDCTYSMFSRMGPRPADQARCQAAIEVAAKLGPDAARYALYRVDTATEMRTNRAFLYQLAGRAGDLTLVPMLVQALDTLDNRAPIERRYERYQITAALQALTAADPKGTPSIAWRTWLDGHDLKHLTRAALLQERIADNRKAASSAQASEAIPAAQWLASQPSTRSDGILALRALLAREDLGEADRRNVARYLQAVSAVEPSGDPMGLL